MLKASVYTEVKFHSCYGNVSGEEEQRAIYRQQLSHFANKPVVMRTLDIGADKDLPYFSIEEENSALGWRGIRFTLDHPEIFLRKFAPCSKPVLV